MKTIWRVQVDAGLIIDQNTRCKKSLSCLKHICREYSLSLGVSICIYIEVLKKFHSYVRFFNVSIIYFYNMINSGIFIFHAFPRVSLPTAAID